MKKGNPSHTQVALKLLNRNVLSNPLPLSISCHFPSVVRATASLVSLASSSPWEQMICLVEVDMLLRWDCRRGAARAWEMDVYLEMIALDFSGSMVDGVWM